MKDILRKLCGIVSPSGFEKHEPLLKNSRRLPDGTEIYVPENAKILLSAHLDTPGYAVNLVKDGKTFVTALGKPETTVGALVEFTNGVHGVLRKDGDSLFVETDAEVKIGDACAYSGNACIGDTVIAPSLDNMISCAVLVKLSEAFPNKFAAALTHGFNLGARGANGAYNAVKPETAVEIAAVPKKKNGVYACVSRGRFSSTTELLDKFKCEKTVADGDITEISRYTLCECASVGVGMTGVNTPYQTALLKDMDSLYELLADFLKNA